MRAVGKSSTFTFHTSSPVAASTACVIAAPSPKKASTRGPADVCTRPMLTADRTPLPAS